MARSRNIKPGFFRNEHLGVVSPCARLLFAGLWCWADREGRLEDRPARLKAEILPYDPVDVDSLLTELAAQTENGYPALLIRYESNGHKYLQIMNFHKHQTPYYKEPESQIPSPDLVQTESKPSKDQAETPLLSFSSSFLDPVSTIQKPPKSPLKGDLLPGIPEVAQSNRKKPKKKREPKLNVEPEYSSEFKRFYAAYPRKIAKREAWYAWEKIRPVPDGAIVDTMICVIEKFKRTAQWQKDGGQYIPYPGAWLNQGRWSDEPDIPLEDEPEDKGAQELVAQLKAAGLGK